MINFEELRGKLRLYRPTVIAKKSNVSRMTIWRFLNGKDIKSTALNKLLEAIND